MDWNLGVFPEPVSKTVAFNQLLDRLRSLHEEVCAQNFFLEQQAANNFSRYLDESRRDDDWLPANFVAPEDGPSPRHPPMGPWRAGIPKVFDVQDILAKHQKSLGHCIDKLAVQQEHLSAQITKILTLPVSVASASESPEGKKAPSALKSKRASASTGAQDTSQSKSCRASASAGLQDVCNVQSVELQVSPKASASTGVHNMAKAASEDLGQNSVSKLESCGSADESTNAAKQQKRLNAKSRFAVQSGLTTDINLVHETSLLQRITTDSALSFRGYVRKFLNGSVFSVVTSLVIVSYTILIAAETNQISQDPDTDSPTIKGLHIAYTGIFSSELLLRFIADGFAVWHGSDAFWNRLDTVLIISGFLEIVMDMASGADRTPTAGSVVRIVRMGRIIRTVRLIRTFHQFHDFQKMTFALISSFKTLICSLALLIFVMFFFAVYLTQSAANLEKRAIIQDLDLRYGDLMSTTYTLFLSVSGGISWDLCFLPLHQLSWWHAQFFMLYIVIVLFGLLNVVTSVFVESVIRSVQHYKDIIVQDKEEERKIAIGHIKAVFRQVDSDGSGQVSIEEMEYFLEDPGLRKYMEALDVETDDTRLLFRLLDCDNSGIVDVEEFCEGCLRLKGSVKSIDIHALMFRIRNFCDRWAEFTLYVEESFSQLRQKLPDGDNGHRVSVAPAATKIERFKSRLATRTQMRLE